MEHTELPKLKITVSHIEAISMDVCTISATDSNMSDNKGYPVAECAGPKSRKHAEYIVRACNAFPAMEKMLQEVVNVIEGDESEWWMDDPDRGGFDLAGIKAALAAGGE